VLEDLWQLSHVTPSYVARAIWAAVLLAYGMMGNKTISIVVAALFMPFLSVLLAAGFGLYSGDRGLARNGAWALLTSVLCSVAGGAVVALIHPGPMQFNDFQTPLTGFALSAIIGTVAGLSSADVTGRRYLIGVAAAVQYAVFPVWLGIALVQGFPPADITLQRLSTLGINLITLLFASTTAYRLIGMRRQSVLRAIHSQSWSHS